MDYRGATAPNKHILLRPFSWGRKDYSVVHFQ